LSKLKRALKEKENENVKLSESINDLQFELDAMRRMNHEENEVKNDKEDKMMDENVPLLIEDTKNERVPRNHQRSKEYVGLPPKEYFMQREWCCGFVCCSHAFGCGSY